MDEQEKEKRPLNKVMRKVGVTCLNDTCVLNLT